MSGASPILARAPPALARLAAARAGAVSRDPRAPPRMGDMARFISDFATSPPCR